MFSCASCSHLPVCICCFFCLLICFEITSVLATLIANCDECVQWLLGLSERKPIKGRRFCIGGVWTWQQRWRRLGVCKTSPNVCECVHIFTFCLWSCLMNLCWFLIVTVSAGQNFSRFHFCSTHITNTDRFSHLDMTPNRDRYGFWTQTALTGLTGHRCL